MIGYLPKTLEVAGVCYQINTDFRASLTILTAFSDTELTNQEKIIVMLRVLYGEENLAHIGDYGAACKEAMWFLNCGKKYAEKEKEFALAPLMDWKQDEQLIFSGIASSIGRDVRMDYYCHYWAFMSYFLGMGECTFTVVKSIRFKLARHQKLEKWEQNFYRENRQIIDIEKEERKRKDLFHEVFGVE